ncbi:transketolase-like TK C-terminal-containing protein [Agromyces bauzanensis]
MPATTTAPTPTAAPAAEHTEVLREIERRVLWLATAAIHHANRVRPNPGGLKVGGHQASSASMTTIMTQLWFEQLRAGDRVSVKPHASPVLHAINALLGELDPAALTGLREFGGLQPYPSRTKDPDPVDYSTGSVGLGATAPLWAAVARRYVDAHGGDAGTGRQYALIGDAELDEGAIWEAMGDPVTPSLGELVWIVDFNRQSLDRVVPALSLTALAGKFEAAGWQVITAKYGRALEALFARPGGYRLRDRLDGMPNPEYQRLLRSSDAELVARLCAGGYDDLAAVVGDLEPRALRDAVRTLGGHDHDTLREAFAGIDDTRPTVIFAYTVKGRGLPMEGHPQNHSALLTAEQFAELADAMGMDAGHPFAVFEPDSAAGRACADAAERLRRGPVSPAAGFAPPAELGWQPKGVTNTQTALGRTLLDLTRRAPDLAARIVTVSPDVSSSTNLGGWVNKSKVWSASPERDWFDDDPETILHWRETKDGQHIELGIAETNLVGLLGELGATWSRWGFPLIPIGVVYDPFVARALEPWTFGMYAGGQSILVGTPSGVTLASEGGAHQSLLTPAIGLQQPGLLAYEPAFAVEVEWMLLEAIRRIGRADGVSSYLRLSTRPVEQSLAAVPDLPEARELRRRQVVAGGYVLRHADASPAATIVAMGALVPEALAAADTLAEAGVPVDVVVVTNAGLLFDAVQARSGVGVSGGAAGGAGADGEWLLRGILPANRAAPMVTVLDGHPHTLSFLAGVNGAPAAHLGVSRLSQAGDLASVYAYHGIDAASITRAVLHVTAAG